MEADAARAEIARRPRHPSRRCCRGARRAAPRGSRGSARRRSSPAASASHFQPCSASSLASCACTSRHSGSRRYETNCARQASTSRRCDSFSRELRRRRIPTARAATGSPSARRGTARCAWSAACCFVERPLARIGHRQRARDHQHLGEAAARRARRGPSGRRADRPAAARARARAASARARASTAPSSCSSW